METQLADAFDGGTNDDQQEQQSEARNYEAEARELGWRPKDEFTGDESRWTDAETFVRKGETMLPLIKKENAHLKRELADLKKTVARASEHFSKAEERAYSRAIADLEARHEQAVEVGDVAAAKAVAKEMRELGNDAKEQAGAAVPEAEVTEALIEWRAANPWYDAGGIKKDYADLMAEKHKAKTASLPPAEFFQLIADEVAKKFPDIKEARKKPPSPVEGGGMNRPRTGQRSFSDLPAQAQQMCDKWVRQGIIKSREDYVKSYQWDKA